MQPFARKIRSGCDSEANRRGFFFPIFSSSSTSVLQSVILANRYSAKVSFLALPVAFTVLFHSTTTILPIRTYTNVRMYQFHHIFYILHPLLGSSMWPPSQLPTKRAFVMYLPTPPLHPSPSATACRRLYCVRDRGVCHLKILTADQ